MSLNHKNDYNSYLHNKMSGEAVCPAMLSAAALLHGSFNSYLLLQKLVLLALTMRSISVLMEPARAGVK